MATTSPDNLRTPNPGDPYNLVADLATLAGDVQAALNTRANAYKGTASQRASLLASAAPGTLWQDTDGIGMLWKRGASAWVPAVWRWAGSPAQRNAFTQAPEGFEWFDTSGGAPMVRLSGAWVPRYSAPFAQASGVVTGVGASYVSVPFPTNRFTVVPVILTQVVSGAGAAIGSSTLVASQSETSFSVRNSLTTAVTIHWTAIQMTSTSAAG